MLINSIRAATVATVLGVAAGSAPLPAQAAPFDGPWSVVVVTKSGPCDPTYRYGLMIQGGRVTYLGGGSVSVSGHVASNGAVSVSVSSGGQSASGSGRLSDGRGGGTWSGRGTSGACSGTWSATQG
jgi:hypothetical protein